MFRLVPMVLIRPSRIFKPASRQVLWVGYISGGLGLYTPEFRIVGSSDHAGNIYGSEGLAGVLYQQYIASPLIFVRDH